jgi:predicted ATP-grasp superfamily ATP-dependent carboligase
VLIFGASVRAAAFSALRAGLDPWCADLFADADLVSRCPTMVVPRELYPHGFLSLASKELPGPWMYTGGMENYRLLVRFMADVRSLWGNDEPRLVLARSPMVLTTLLRKAGLPYAELATKKLLKKRGTRERRWLLKPMLGTGGADIRWYTGAPELGTLFAPTAFTDVPEVPPLTATGDERYNQGYVYLQEYIDGEPCAAIYVGDGKDARLLGVTRQLVGAAWLNAAPFHYCGSIGPMPLTSTTGESFTAIGRVLAKGCRLLGVFGVDCILRDGVPYPVEINPRYTASVEVLELATGLSILELHRRIFEQGPASGGRQPPEERHSSCSPVVGKAILFARETFSFPADGPWTATLRQRPDVWDLLPFADIPTAGEEIPEGAPVMTCFASGDSVAECEARLRDTAAELGDLFRAR